MSSVTNMDNSNMNFQTPAIRRNRDKKSDGKLKVPKMCVVVLVQFGSTTLGPTTHQLSSDDERLELDDSLMCVIEFKLW